jgi:hypothetical protein
MILCVECGNPAEYVFKGNSYCDNCISDYIGGKSNHKFDRFNYDEGGIL